MSRVSPSRSLVRPVRSVRVSFVKSDHCRPCPVRTTTSYPKNITHANLHHRILSVDLKFKDAPKDLMKKFVDTLVRLPNLRTLELLSISHRSPVTAGLKRKCATFPNIREIIISPKYPDFVTSCPNLESLTFRYGFTPRSPVAIDLCGEGLKRVAGIDFSMDRWVSCELACISPVLKQLNGTMLQTWYKTAPNSRR